MKLSEFIELTRQLRIAVTNLTGKPSTIVIGIDEHAFRALSTVPELNEHLMIDGPLSAPGLSINGVIFVKNKP